MLTYFEIPEEYGYFPKGELEGILEGVEIVLKTWGQTASRKSGSLTGKSDPRFLEFSVGFLGRFFGILNVRATLDMAKSLLDSAKGTSINHLSQEEIIKEFSAVVMGRLTAHLWVKNWGVFVCGVPQLSASGIWADGKPLASCAFAVEDWPVEVRLMTEKLAVRSQTRKLNKKVSMKKEKSNA
jgi:hypothetical protein